LPAAEIYGFGKSEEFLGEFIRASGTQDKAKVATKFATLPWRFTSNSVVEACKVCIKPVLQPHDYSPHIWVQVNRASLLGCETSIYVLTEVKHGFCLMCQRLADVVKS